jgi:methionine-gamma-lyase
MRSNDTTVVHAGRERFDQLGVHAPPIDRSTTYPLTSLDEGTESLDAMAAGGHPEGSAVYARLHNPTVASWEQGIAQLEQADEAVAFGSGMAAITAVLLAAGAVGRHVVGVRPLYGGTDHLLASGLLGCRVTWARPDEVAAAIEDDTALVVVETPSNPTLQLVDLGRSSTAAGDVPVLVDNTFATPILQQPLTHGATWAVHSATKALGGHSDVIAGVVATDATGPAPPPGPGRHRRAARPTGGLPPPPLAAHPGAAGPGRADQRAGPGRTPRRPPCGHAVHYPGLASRTTPGARRPADVRSRHDPRLRGRRGPTGASAT